MAFSLRAATLADTPELERLIVDSVRGLSPTLRTCDRGGAGHRVRRRQQLIRDGTYFVAEAGTALVACGG